MYKHPPPSPTPIRILKIKLTNLFWGFFWGGGNVVVNISDNNSVHPVQLKRDAACLPHICVQGRVYIYDCFKVQFDGLGKNPQIYTT